MSDEPLTTDRDDLHDRLLDRALREKLGGEKAPDLSAGIVTAAKAISSVSPAAAAIIENPLSSTPLRWGWLAIAASLLVVAGALIWPAMNTGREAARRAEPNVLQLESSQSQSGDAPGEVGDASIAAGDLQMMVTPHVVVADDAGEGQAGEGEEGAVDAEVGDLMELATSTVQPEAFAAQQQAENHYGAATAADAEVALQIAGMAASSTAPTGTGAAVGNWGRLAGGGRGGRGGSGPGSLGGGASGRTSQQLYYEREHLAIRSKQLGVDSRAYGPLGWHDRPGGDFTEAALPRDKYAEIIDNPFRAISADSVDNRLSTFSIDVDTASYANVRQFLLQGNRLPPPDAVRIEELVNYFKYNYAAPTGDDPFAAHIEVAACPWAPKHRLVRFGIKGREVERAARPKSNLVFLIDVSGSMDDPQKLPLLVEGMRMLTRELGENDRVAIVVYASTEGLALESTRGDQQERILAALDRLSAGGSTAGGAGIQLAYQVAADNFIEGGTNRVILCTDGDFNVGVTDVEALKQLAAHKAKDTGVFLTVLGFGRGNLNDELMEAVADNGNGAYHYVDNRSEARKVLVEELSGTLVTIAKDVKIQVEFNPAQVAAYRLIGYENRVLAAEDFNNDARDAGEIGAGHTVTALYEIVPVGEEIAATSSDVDELKYAPPADKVELNQFDGDVDARKYGADGEASRELLTLKIRYKQPDGDTSTKLEFPVTDGGAAFAKASSDFQFASSVAGFGMLLRGSPYKGEATFGGMLEIAESAAGNEDPRGYRREFTQMIAKAKQLAGE